MEWLLERLLERLWNGCGTVAGTVAETVVEGSWSTRAAPPLRSGFSLRKSTTLWYTGERCLFPEN